MGKKIVFEKCPQWGCAAGDDTGNRTINIIQWAKITNIERLNRKSFIDNELRKPSWMVDGVCIHEIEFRKGDLYYACAKDSKN